MSAKACWDHFIYLWGWEELVTQLARAVFPSIWKEAGPYAVAETQKTGNGDLIVNVAAPSLDIIFESLGRYSFVVVAIDFVGGGSQEWEGRHTFIEL